MMMQLHIPNVWASIKIQLSGLRRTQEPRPVSESTAEERRAERDLIDETIWSNPEAFSSGLDIEYMMRMSRGRR